jgi:hypothetical protein
MGVPPGRGVPQGERSTACSRAWDTAQAMGAKRSRFLWAAIASRLSAILRGGDVVDGLDLLGAPPR